MSNSIKHGGHVWEYRVTPCVNDDGNPSKGFCVEVLHPGNLQWELAGYSEYCGKDEIQEIVAEFADSQTSP